MSSAANILYTFISIKKKDQAQSLVFFMPFLTKIDLN